MRQKTETGRALLSVAALALVILLAGLRASGAEGSPEEVALDVESILPEEAGLDDSVTLNIPNLSDPSRAEKLILFLDNIPIKENHPLWADKGRVGFELKHSEENKNEWARLLSNPKSHLRQTEVRVGFEDQGPAGKGKTLRLRIYNRRYFNFVVIGFLIALGAFLVLAWKTNIIRDAMPREVPEGAKRPYSLARAQIAWWFFIIFGSFLLIRIVTHDIDTINSTALVLLGIGTGTALSAAVVDNNKHDSTRKELRALRPKQATLQVAIEELKKQIDGLEGEALSSAKKDLAGKEAELEQVDKQVSDVASALNKPVSEGFVTDILSDINGVSFHRFQIVAWTITLGFIFIRSVYKDLGMPDFSDTILTLMGISAGTYIGFKIPERQTDPEPPPPAGGNN